MNIKDILEVFDTSVEFIQNTDMIMYSGLFGALFGGGQRREEDDNEFVESVDIINEIISNADLVGVTKGIRGRDLRDQITIDEVLDHTEEANTRRWPFNRRN